MKKKELIIKTLGVFFLFYGLFAIGFSIYRGKPDWIFWFCYISMTLIGIGALMKDGKLIASQINLVAGYLIVWDIDFFYLLIIGKPLWGVTDYFFRELMPIARLISIEHFFLLPISLYLLYEIKTEKGHLRLSLIQGTIIYILTIVLTNPRYNVNCAFNSCVTFLPEKYYQLTWYILSVTTIWITSIIINNIYIFNKKINKKGLKNYKK
ncbi:MAG: hypothetical protein QW727_00335 [Candidatus Pacearchaeota archaeon]